MVRLVALDLVLRLVLAGMVDVALVVDVPRVHAEDMAAHAPGLGIPADVVAALEGFFGGLLRDLGHGETMPERAGVFQGNGARRPSPSTLFELRRTRFALII